MTDYGLFSVFLVGLLGGTHCAGMCGGIVTALSMQLPGNGVKWSYHLAYNSGRILSYGVAGALVGAVGAGSLLFGAVLPVREALYLAANLMLIALGLYLSGIWQAVAKLEQAGAVIWRQLQPHSKKLLPVDSPSKAFVMGTLWGWLPCGLVYSVLFTALMSGSVARGAGLMLAFGLGTLPNLMTMGIFAGRLQPLVQQRPVRVAAGIAVMAFGVIGLVRAATYPAGFAEFCRVAA